MKTEKQEFDVKKTCMFACIDENFRNALEDLAKKNTINLVEIPSKIIFDYECLIKGKKEYDSEVEAFIADQQNVHAAKQKTIELWNLLTDGKDIEKMSQTTFARAQVIKAAGLTYEEATDIINVLKVFGFVKIIDEKTQTFKLQLEFKDILEVVNTEIQSFVYILNHTVKRYKTLIESSDVDSAQKNMMWVSMSKYVIDEIFKTEAK